MAGAEGCKSLSRMEGNFLFLVETKGVGDGPMLRVSAWMEIQRSLASVTPLRSPYRNMAVFSVGSGVDFHRLESLSKIQLR